jgi:hypothetical protein
MSCDGEITDRGKPQQRRFQKRLQPAAVGVAEALTVFVATVLVAVAASGGMCRSIFLAQKAHSRMCFHFATIEQRGCSVDISGNELAAFVCNGHR